MTDEQRRYEADRKLDLEVGWLGVQVIADLTDRCPDEFKERQMRNAIRRLMRGSHAGRTMVLATTKGHQGPDGDSEVAT